MKSVETRLSDENKDRYCPIELLTNLAVKNHKNGNLQEAIACYLNLINSDCNQPAWIYANLITLFGQTKNLAEGLKLELKALELHAESDEIHRALGVLYENSSDSSNCILHYQKAIDIEPNQPEWLYCNLAKRLLDAQESARAADICQQGISLYSKFHYLYYILGNALTEQEKWDRSILAYLRVQELAPDWKEIEERLNIAIYKKSQLERHNSSIYYDIHPTETITVVETEIIEAETTAIEAEIIEAETTAIEAEIVKINNLENIDAEWLFSKLEQQNIELSDCQEIWNRHEELYLTLDYGCWLSPSIIYFEATVDKCWIFNLVEVLACSQNKYAITKANFFQISNTQVAAVACFQKDLYLNDYEDYKICIKHGKNLVLLKGGIFKKAYSLEFIEYLKQKPKHQKHLIREKSSQSIIKLIPENLKPEAKNFLNKIQYFLDIPASNYINPDLPFKIFIDYIIPLKCDGLFISGWLHDPYKMLEKITAISALGFSIELFAKDIHRIERQDVNEFLRNTRYGNFDEKLGFCAYASVPDAIQKSIQGFAELHSFRFIVRLKGNIDIEIIPDIKYSDFYNARRQVMQITSPEKVSEQMLVNCIAPAGLKLQQLCIEQVRIKDVTAIGKQVDKPLISIVIPLYRRLDFMKVQLATMANDPSTKQCEIIYVLDSPEQEDELKTFLLNHCALYQLPVKLVVMERNAGYAAANNAGASQAKGKYLIMLNSDVFAKTKGWALKMAEFYASSPKIGTLGAKLVYEDGALQHAGMFFAYTTFPFWLTLHYYKGLPGNYALAQQSRPVPAVTGACLMIDRKLYEDVGGFTTDYVIGDFEDSDLCLKCGALGYKSWYFADATLYHLERQSVPLNSVYNGSLAWRLNARLHQERWGEQIAHLMNIHQQ